jgi:diaminohydroxyphosphoribosylaminopyrimidine deaminase/5-amino-6-(5-phosphoribosylamino)uracil reductase
VSRDRVSDDLPERDEAWMRRALEEARRGRPSPNPHVGAVITTADGELVSVGHHERAGQAHAEVDAIRNAPFTEGTTLYVTMEPCNHHGRTPPCTEAILAAKIARVVIGAIDPKPHVPGSVEKLRAAGVEVVTDVLADECRALLADFTKHITTGRPFVTLKAAVTLDGRMAARTGDSKWITGELARAEAHRMRDASDAVLVGVGTVLADDPRLDVRHVEGKSPTRVVLDRTLRTPPSAAMLGLPGATWIVHGPDVEPERRTALTHAGATLFEVPLVNGALSLDAMLDALGRRDVVRLLVEGGPRVHGALLAAAHADRMAVFVAPRVLGDEAAPAFATGAGVIDTIAAGWRLRRVQVRVLGDDVLVEGDVVRGS